MKRFRFLLRRVVPPRPRRRFLFRWVFRASLRSKRTLLILPVPRRQENRLFQDLVEIFQRVKKDVRLARVASRWVRLVRVSTRTKMLHFLDGSVFPMSQSALVVL
jgi:hypothetical protein